MENCTTLLRQVTQLTCEMLRETIVEEVRTAMTELIRDKALEDALGDHQIVSLSDQINGLRTDVDNLEQDFNTRLTIPDWDN